MPNVTKQTPATSNTEKLTVAFQKFNDVFLAKISNLVDRETFAYGETKRKAQHNALRNYKIKYGILTIN